MRTADANRGGVRPRRAGWSSARWGRAGGVAALSAAHETGHRAPRQQLPAACGAVLPVLRARRCSACWRCWCCGPASAEHELCWTRSGSCAPAGAGRVSTYPAHQDGKGEIDLSFAPEGVAQDHDRPAAAGQAGPPGTSRRARVLLPGGRAALGDIAVAGSESYANFADQLLSWEGMRAADRRATARRGGPARRGAAEATAALRAQLEEGGRAGRRGVSAQHRPGHRRGPAGAQTPARGRERRASALALEAALGRAAAQRGILDILTRTAYAIGWHRHFGQASGVGSEDPGHAGPVRAADLLPGRQPGPGTGGPAHARPGQRARAGHGGTSTPTARRSTPPPRT